MGPYDQPPTPAIDDETALLLEEEDTKDLTTMKPKLFKKEESIQENESMEEEEDPEEEPLEEKDPNKEPLIEEDPEEDLVKEEPKSEITHWKRGKWARMCPGSYKIDTAEQ